jgi:hypothetical protein
MARRGLSLPPKLSVADVRGQAARLVGAWTVKPELVVLKNMDHAPAPVRQYFDAMDAQAAGDEVGAFFWKDTLYILADVMQSRTEIIRMVMHEGLGHYGMNKLYGKEFGDILREMLIVREKAIRAKAKEYGFDWNDPNERLIAAEEHLVEMAETRPDLGFVRRAIAAIRTWMRKHVFGLDAMRVSDDEIVRLFIEPARRFVETGKPGPGGKRPTLLRKFPGHKNPSYARGGARPPVAGRPLPQMPPVRSMYPTGNPRLSEAAKAMFEAYADAVEAWRTAIKEAVHQQKQFSVKAHKQVE